jgi:Spy/CpxP family protein refolding chaperone
MNRLRLGRHPASAVALIALLLTSVAGPVRAERDGERRDAYRSLRLPRDRAERLRNLQRQVERENRQLKERLEDRRDDLEELYREYEYEENRARRLRREIRDLQSQLVELHHRLQAGLRSILTKSEFERLQRRLREERRRHDNDDDD